jgi:molybdopterin converting factor subunit 1
MKVAVKLFAVARQRVGSSSIDVELPTAATVAQLRSALAEQFPPLAEILRHSRLAVGNEYATETTPVSSMVEIALIPPVSGG